MKINIYYKKYKIYFLSLENDNSKDAFILKKTRVYLATFIDENSLVNDEKNYFYTMTDVMNHMHELSKKENICVCVYDLKAVWSFIQPFLTRWGFTFKNHISDDDTNCYNVLCDATFKKIWCARIKFEKNANFIYFKDFQQMFNCKLDVLPDNFGLKTKKLNVDIEKVRLNKNYMPTEDEKNYSFNNAKILCEIAEKLRKDGDFWNKCSLAGSTIKKYIREAYGYKNPYLEYRKNYPETKELEILKLLQGSMHPALMFTNPDYQFKTVKKAFIIDLRQSYPSAVVAHNYPFGNGVFIFDDETVKKIYKKLYDGNISTRECLLVYGKLSYIATKIPLFSHHLNAGSNAPEFIALWGEELKLIYENYIGVKFDFIVGIYYECKKFDLAPSFEKTFNKRKEAEEKGNKWLSKWLKLSNNSGAGKFIEKGNDYIFKPKYKKGVLGVEAETPQILKTEGKYAYYPVGLRIIMWGRIKLFNTMLKFGIENVIDCNTDAITIKTTPETLKIRGTLDFKNHLGGWELKGDVENYKAVYAQRKTYIKDGKIINVIAGVSKPEKVIDIENGFAEVTSIMMLKYDPKADIEYAGGFLIHTEHKQLQITEKYKKLYEKNHGQVIE